MERRKRVPAARTGGATEQESPSRARVLAPQAKEWQLPPEASAHLPNRTPVALDLVRKATTGHLSQDASAHLLKGRLAAPELVPRALLTAGAGTPRPGATRAANQTGVRRHQAPDPRRGRVAPERPTERRRPQRPRRAARSHRNGFHHPSPAMYRTSHDDALFSLARPRSRRVLEVVAIRALSRRHALRSPPPSIDHVWARMPNGPGAPCCHCLPSF